MTQVATVRVLLVEDNPGDAQLVEIMLSEAGSSAGFEVAHAGTLGEALGRLAEASFNIILLDLSLPDLSGLETVSRMRKAAPRTPIVVLSGYDDEEVAFEAVQRGAQDYLIKGQGDGELIARTIRYSIERRRAEEELRESEERFRLLVEGVEDYAIFMLDPEGRVASWNEGAERIEGYTTEEICGEHFSLFYTDEEVRRGDPEEELQIAATKGRFQKEGLRVRKDGSSLWADIVITALRDEAGNLRGFSKLIRDITGRKEAEEALRRSLKEMGDLKFALDESAIVAIADVTGKITYVNDKYCEISGYSRGELLDGKRRLVDPGQHPREVVEDLWRTIGQGLVWRGEIGERARDATIYWLEMIVVPFLDERGKPHRYVAVCQDITDRKNAEEALKKSEGRFRALIQNASDIIVVLDADGTILYESPTVERILGFKPEERVGTNILDHVYPDDAGWVRDKLTDIRERTQERASMWYRVRDKEGSWHHFEAIATNLLHDPTVEGIVLNARDITERRRAEEALRDSEAGYRTLVEQMPATTYIEAVDHGERRTNLLYVSPQIEDMFGYSPDEWMSDPELFPKLLHPEDRERVLAEDARTDKTGESFKVEYRQFTKDGRVVWIRDEAVLVRDQGGNPLFWQGVMHDITDQKQAEERLRKTLGSLLALHEAGQILGSTLERAEIGSRLLEIMERTSGLEAAVIDLNGEQPGPWRTTGPEYLWREARSAPEAQAARREVLEAAERRVFRLQKPGDKDGIVLVGLYLPLLVRERLTGILEVYGPEAVAEEHNVETITSLAGLAASALEHARLYEEGAERERRLRALVGRVMVAQEEERRRVAYEVHDGLAQTAAAAHHLLQAFARGYPVGPAEGRIILDRALDLVQQTVGEARDVISDLRPTALDDFGLALAIRQQIEKLSGEGRRIEYEEALGDERLPNAVETTLYRVAQEALMNVHKHASSARARVTLQRLDGSVCLRVRDWGQGFRFEEVRTGDGPGRRVGLSSMRERVALLGGSFEIHSEPGAGTEVVAEIPLPEDSGYGR
jgi:PAS domain S-box-containing protein